MEIRKIDALERDTLDGVVSIHLETFQGFFLTFMGRGFLRLMYRSYAEFEESGILVAFENENPIGFLAYSGNLSGLYQYMIKKRLIPFAWYSLGAFVRKPKVFMRLIRAFLKPGETKREEAYVKLGSLGVLPKTTSKGVGTRLVEALKDLVDFSKYAYIALETDAERNDGVNRFYQKNGFYVAYEFETKQKRKMVEYRYGKEYKDLSSTE